MSSYTAAIHWTRKSGELFTDGKYSRAHSWSFDGGAVVLASSSPSVVRLPFSDPAGVDPEEALVAPHIHFSGDKRPSAADVEAIHHEAHDACYIANSVKSEIRVEGSAEGLRD